MESLSLTEYSFEAKSQNVDQIKSEDKEKLEKHKQSLQFVSIKGNSYGINFFKEFAPMIKDMTQLTKIDFSDIFVGRKKDEIPQCLEMIASSLLTKNIISMDISHNAVNIFGAQALSVYLKQANPLKVFYINNCGLGPEGVEVIAQSLAEGAPNLEALAITRNRAEDRGAQAVGLMVQKCPNFRELHMQQDVIRKEGMIVLLKNLANCPKLELVDIRDNFLKEEAATEMANLIEKCPNLKSLNISDCNLEEDENEIIIEALKKSQVTQLEKIGYNYNELNGPSANQFLDALLDKSKVLSRIDIKGNEFKKSNKEYYEKQLQEKGFDLKVLSAYESDEDEDGTDLIQQFNELKL